MIMSPWVSRRKLPVARINDHKPAKITLIKKPTIASPVITTTSSTSASPINLSVTFKQDGVNTSLSGFDLSDAIVTNATKSDFAGSGHTYTLRLPPRPTLRTSR